MFSISVASNFRQVEFRSSFWRLHRDGVEKEQWLELLKSLEGILLNSAEDRWSWKLTGSGDFSVASVRNFIDNTTLPVVSSKTKWIKEVPIKVNILAWKVRLDYLPTRWRLSNRGMDIPSLSCPLCEGAVETSAHLFFECCVVKDIIRKICIWWNVNVMEFSSFDGWASWILNLRISSKHKNILEGVCYALWWFIWTFRNKKIFGVMSPSKANIYDDVVLYSFYWCRYRSKVSFSWVDWLKNPYLVSL